ncbi:MAG: hypothetical protein IKA61_05060 [Clostridia bacterium]|nr:hypothetical protein [Clostridia bacterium]
MNSENVKTALFAETGEEQDTCFKKKAISALEEIVFFVLLFAITVMAFIYIKPYYKNSDTGIRAGVYAQSIMAILIACILVVGVVMIAFKGLDRKSAIYLLFMIGVVIRLCYMLYTPITSRQHDTFNRSHTGHEAYAWTIFSTGKLPATNDYQFYHPPLNAFIQANFMKFMQAFTTFLTEHCGFSADYFPDKFLQSFSSSKLPKGSEMRFFLFSTNQILAVMYSVITMVYALKLVKLFDFKGSTAVLVSAIVILFPRHVQFAGMVNNDALSYMCSVLALYFAVKWQKKGRQIWNILLCALFVGLGMMTKLATATICLPIGGIFVYEFILALQDFIKDIKSKEKLNIKKHIYLPIQFICFLIICAPLGLWFQVYAKATHGQGFGFVFGNLNKLLATDHHSLFERLFFTFDFNEYFGSLYCVCFSDKNYAYYNNYNLFNYQVRSAIFGEFSYWQGEGFAVVALLFAWISCFVLAIGLIKCLLIYIKYNRRQDVFKTDEKIIDIKDFIILFLLVVSQVLPEIFFYIKMPYACTMDFRYVMPLITGLALMTGYVKKTLISEGSAFSIGLNKVMTIVITVFLVSSSLFYCTCI